MNSNNEKDLAPLGFCNFRNRRTKFGIKLDDRRRHVYLIGKTGVGKTTLLENMAIADIKAGRGLAVVDPHGELAEKVLDFVPEERMDDVIYFNPADMEYPVAFNPMEQVNPEFRHLVASGLMGVFKKIFVDVWSARMAYILNNTLLALLELPGSTLLGIMRMLSEPVYRKKIVENLKDPVVKAFWVNEFARYTQRLETEAVAAIQNKVGQFISNPLIRNILGQPNSTLNMREIMDSGKIFIANLSKGRIGEDNSALLGAMVITRLQLAAMSRVDMPEEQRRDFFLYVDEFQNFATDSFANILSEARKYRLSLILAHQYIGQLMTDQSTKVRDSVFGNIGTIICFRVGGADAEFLETEFTPEFLQNDLVNLAKANIYIKLMIDGVASRPFSAETPPPQKIPLLVYKDVIIKNSQQKYGTPRKIVEDKIASEWQTASETLVDEKVSRQYERPLRQTLQGSSPERRPPSSYASSAPASRPEPRIVPLKRFRPAGETAATSNRPGPEVVPLKRPYFEDGAVARGPATARFPSANFRTGDTVREPAPTESRVPQRTAERPQPQETRPYPQETKTTPGSRPQIFQPKVHPKTEVNIEELRKAISDSLRRNNLKNDQKESAPPPTTPPRTPPAALDERSEGADQSKKKEDSPNINDNISETETGGKDMAGMSRSTIRRDDKRSGGEQTLLYVSGDYRENIDQPRPGVTGGSYGRTREREADRPERESNRAPRSRPTPPSVSRSGLNRRAEAPENRYSQPQWRPEQPRQQSQPQPQQQPKIYQKFEVNIGGLREAISDSLRKVIPAAAPRSAISPRETGAQSKKQEESGQKNFDGNDGENYAATKGTGSVAGDVNEHNNGGKSPFDVTEEHGVRWDNSDLSPGNMSEN